MLRILVLCVLLAGMALTGLSCVMPWFAIPVGAEPLHLDPSGVHWSQPHITAAYRVVAVCVLGTLIVAWSFGRASTVGAAAASLWFACLLTYPYLVMVWDAPIAGDAAWLEAQHRNLVRSAGDLNTSTGDRTAGSFDNLVLTEPPQTVNPIEMSEWLPPSLSLGRFPDLVDRLGYSNKFFQFIRRGWVAALMGVFLMMTALCALKGSLHIDPLYRMGAVFSAAFLMLCLTGWSWSFVSASDLAAAARHTARGEYQLALDAMHRAEAKLPALSQDTYFISQMGLLEDGLAQATPAARLYRARLDEVDGKRHLADATYEELMSDASTPYGVRREACRALLHSAISALNSGRTNAAADLLEEVLTVEPCNIKANYALQLAYLRSGSYDQVAPLAKRMEAVYECFQHDSKLAVVSASYQNALAADATLGNIEAAVEDNRRVVQP